MLVAIKIVYHHIAVVNGIVLTKFTEQVEARTYGTTDTERGMQRKTAHGRVVWHVCVRPLTW